MSTGLIPFGQKSVVSSIFEGLSGLSKPREKFPSISVLGGKFAFLKDGERTVLKDADGIPVSVFKCVVVGVHDKYARSFRGKEAFDPENPTPPLCQSYDGVSPSAESKSPKSQKCAECPMSIKGSWTNPKTGKPETPCKMSRILAIVPEGQDSVYRLNLPITSVYDKKFETGQWRCWEAYRSYLDAHGEKHPAGVGTKIIFDGDAGYPKMLFAPEGHLSDEQKQAILPICKSEIVAEICGFSKPYHPGPYIPYEEGQTAQSSELAKEVQPLNEVQQPEKVEEPAPKVEKPKAVKKAPDPVVETNADLESALSDWD